MAIKYWLMKSAPDEFSLEELKNSENQIACWDGVRNYQARNFMRDEMQVGDRVLFYRSRENPAVVGTARVVKAGYPDHTSWDQDSKYFDPKSMMEKPVWYMVDIQFEMEFLRPMTLAELRAIPGLNNMVLLRKGSRLSVQPVTEEEFRLILKLGSGEAQRNRGNKR